jgi:integrase
MARWAKCYRRKDTHAERWVVYLHWHGRRWVRTTFDTIHPIYTTEMAESLCAEINGEIRKNLKAFLPEKWFGRGDAFKFSRYAWAWLDAKRPEIQAVTYQSYHLILLRAEKQFGKLDIEEIRAGHLEDFIRNIQGQGAKQNAANVLKALFRDAFRREDIDRVPGLPVIKGQPNRKPGLDRATQDALIAKLPEYDRSIFRFLQTYGCRVSEAIALKWDCVLWAQHEVVLRRTVSGKVIREARKAGDRINLPMPEPIEAMLKAIQVNNPWSLWVFVNKDGRRYRRQYLDGKLREACRAIGILPVGAHVFGRHSKAHQLMDSGHSIDIVAAVLGHQNPATTRRHYARVGTDVLRGVLD